MTIFIRFGKVCSMSMEFNKEFGTRPLFKRTSYRCETILDMPYTQLIFTSGKWTPLRRAANDHEDQFKKTEKTADNPAGTYRDRS
jgi:hypothetical protein